jgi:hypothetical protein
VAVLGGGDPSTPTRIIASDLVDGNVVGWVLTVYPGAGEAGGSFRSSDRPRREGNGGGVQAEDPERPASEAARRARSKTRRFCAANRLNRLGTLTYRGEGCHDRGLPGQAQIVPAGFEGLAVADQPGQGVAAGQP